MAQLQAGFDALGVRHLPSAGNFVLIDCGRPAAPVYEAMLRQGVIVRPVGNYGLPNHLRITIGTRAQNERMLSRARRQALQSLTHRTWPHYVVQPVTGVAGAVRVPGDKSISHRALMLGGIAEGVTEVAAFSKARTASRP